MPESRMNRVWCSKVASVSLSKPTMKPAEHVDAVRVNAPHRGEDVFVQVLGLQRLLQAVRVGRFDADEHPGEVRFAEQFQQFPVLRQVERRLGAEAERPVVLALVVGEETQQFLRHEAMADQVVVDEEHVAHAGRPAARPARARPAPGSSCAACARTSR